MRSEKHTGHLFYWVMDLFLGTKAVDGWRKKSLSGVKGNALEIGVGTGLSFPNYPSSVRTITATDLSATLDARAAERANQSHFTVQYHPITGEKLPFPDQTFDAVVTQFTLCSIDEDKMKNALREIHRVLKPDGRYFFLEHGLSQKASMALWQRRITPLQQLFAGGCHLDRDIEKLLKDASFQCDPLDKFYYGIKIWGSMYQGVATKKQ